jgi:hypothetical protein
VKLWINGALVVIAVIIMALVACNNIKELLMRIPNLTLKKYQISIIFSETCYKNNILKFNRKTNIPSIPF